MPQLIFVNLPVRDVARATAFYSAIGCTQDPRFSNQDASAMQLSETISFMLLSHPFFQGFTPKTISNAHDSTEVLLAISRDSREAVDEMVAKAAENGGRADVRPVQDLGFMYSRAFEDPDGHMFEPMFMDMEAAMAAFAQNADQEG